MDLKTNGHAAYDRLLSKHQLASTWTVVPSQASGVAQQAIGVRGVFRFKPSVRQRGRPHGGGKEGDAHLVTHVPTAKWEISLSSLAASSAEHSLPAASLLVPRAEQSSSPDVKTWCDDSEQTLAATPPTKPPPALHEESLLSAAHPAARSPVLQLAGEMTRRMSGALKPRPPLQPRIIPDLKPLYFFDGVTGYDFVQHRPSSGMYGSRPFSMRAAYAFNVHNGLRDEPLAGPCFVHQETSKGSVHSGSIGYDQPPADIQLQLCASLSQVFLRMLLFGFKWQTNRRCSVSRTRARIGKLCVLKFQIFLRLKDWCTP